MGAGTKQLPRINPLNMIREGMLLKKVKQRTFNSLLSQEREESLWIVSVLGRISPPG